jgi:hypothetical protein
MGPPSTTGAEVDDFYNRVIERGGTDKALKGDHGGSSYFATFGTWMSVLRRALHVCEGDPGRGTAQTGADEQARFVLLMGVLRE